MNLALDIGNTRTKIGVFEEEELISLENYLNEDSGKILQSIEKVQYQNVIVSATGVFTEEIRSSLKPKKRFIELDHITPIPIKNVYRTPETLGKDRLAAVVGATASYPEQNNFVIDIGTCITYDFVDKEKIYWGGNIAPGVEMRYKAMNSFTAKLPLVERAENANIIGVSTETAMQNGGLFGVIFEIEGFVERLMDQYKVINIILTGGDAEFFASKLKTEIFVHQNLVLRGLNEIIRYNV